MSKIVDAPPAPEDLATSVARERWHIRRARRAPPDMPQRENTPLSELARDVVNGADIDEVHPSERLDVAKEAQRFWIEHGQPVRNDVAAECDSPSKTVTEHVTHIVTAVCAAEMCGYSGDRRFIVAVDWFLKPLGIPGCDKLNDKSLKKRFNRMKRDAELPSPDERLLGIFIIFRKNFHPLHTLR